MMRVGIIGLGLIGGSMAKAYKRDPHWEVYGANRSKSIVDFALIAQAIDGDAQREDLARIALDLALRSYAGQLACARILDVLQPEEDPHKKGKK